MRKWNAIISVTVLALFLVHAVVGGFQIIGVLPGGSPVMKWLAWIMAALIGAHAVIGIVLTVQTLHAQRKAGVSYPKENRLFWTRRLSGFAVMLFIVCHLLIFAVQQGADGTVRLHPFGAAELVTQLLLVASVAVHVLTNIKPLLIAMGARGMRELFTDILLVLTLLLLFMGAAFVIYLIRWNV